MSNADYVLDVIRRRRSFKPAALRPDAVPREVLEKVLEAANWAPSHGQTEPWRFSVFTGEGRRSLGEAFSSAYKENAGEKYAESQFVSFRDRVWSAPVWISIGMMPGIKPDGTRAMPEEEEVLAVACAVQNLHLMATSLGLGGQWTSNGTIMKPSVARFVGLEAPGRLLGFFFLGYPTVEWPAGKRRPLAEKVRWVE